MNRSITLCLATLMLASCGMDDMDVEVEPFAGSSAKFLKSDDPVHGRYMVFLEEQRGLRGQKQHQTSQRVAEELAGPTGASVELRFEHLLDGFVVEGLSEDEALAMSKDPRVAFVEEDGWVSANETQTLYTLAIGGSIASTKVTLGTKVSRTITQELACMPMSSTRECAAHIRSSAVECSMVSPRTVRAPTTAMDTALP